MEGGAKLYLKVTAPTKAQLDVRAWLVLRLLRWLWLQDAVELIKIKMELQAAPVVELPPIIEEKVGAVAGGC